MPQNKFGKRHISHYMSDKIDGLVARSASLGLVSFPDPISIIIVSSLIKHVPISFNRNQVNVIMTGVLI